MKYYISSPYSGSRELVEAINTVKPDNVLISIADNTGVKNLEKIIKTLEIADLIIDSGAFSVWNSGHTMTIDKTIKAYDNVAMRIPKNIRVNFINLDVIPGSKGHKPDKKQVDVACEQSWENYMVMKKRYNNVLPVFHENDDFKYLYMMMKETDYIAISPANDSSTKKRMLWLDKVYSILGANYKTHGLAATSETLLKRYPFYSVDSINWKTIDMYGNSKVYEKRLASKLTRNASTRPYAIASELRYHLELANKMTRLWQQRGVIWND